MIRKFQHQLTYAKFPQRLYHGDKLKFVEEFLSRGKAQQILDLGCGAVPYNSPGNYVSAIDADTRIVTELQRAGQQGVILADANIHIPCPDGTFDVALLLDVIEHFYQPDMALSEVRRVLKPNGHVLIFTPNFASWLYTLVEKIYFPLACRYHKEQYSEHVFNNKPRALRSYLERYFAVEDLKLCSYGMAVFIVCRKEP